MNSDGVNKDGKTALHYAAIWKRDIIMKYLLDPVPHGAEVHTHTHTHTHRQTHAHMYMYIYVYEVPA